MRQALNKVKVEGILSENALKYGSYVKNGETVEDINGYIKVLVDTVIDGKELTIEVPVYFFQNQLKKNGEPNPAYENLKKAMEELKSIGATGSAATADKVRIAGEVRMNEFVSQNGNVVSYPRINASFINRPIGDFEPKATFEMEFIFNGATPVVDKDGVEVEPAKYTVDAILPQYGNRVDVVKLTASNPKTIAVATEKWEVGCAYPITGLLNFSSTTETIEEEQDFGPPKVKTRTTSVNELIISGGSVSPLDEDVFPQDEVVAAVAERKTRLENLKNQPKKAPAKAASKGALDLGF